MAYTISIDICAHIIRDEANENHQPFILELLVVNLVRDGHFFVNVRPSHSPFWRISSCYFNRCEKIFPQCRTKFSFSVTKTCVIKM